MVELINLFKNNILFWIIMFLLNCIIIGLTILKVKTNKGRYSREARGIRKSKNSLYKRLKIKINKELDMYERGDKEKDLYTKAKDKVRKAGYKNKYAALIYLLCKYCLPVIMFIFVYLISIPDILRPTIVSVICYAGVELIIYQKKVEINMKFQRHIYKIYKYLNNQISSGVKVTDAIKTIHQIIEDEDIKMNLIRLAAKYELTMDIDQALEEIRSRYDNQEAETLAVAIKQGVTTGENNDLLEHQEELMFNNYINYIQAETDRRIYVSLAAAVVFCFIIVVMVSAPLLTEAITGIEEMFRY